MRCCICGKDLTGLPAMVDKATDEAYCEQHSDYFGLDRASRPVPGGGSAGLARGQTVSPDTPTRRIWLRRLGILTAGVGALNGIAAYASFDDFSSGMPRGVAVVFAIGVAVVAFAYFVAFGVWYNNESKSRVGPAVTALLGIIVWACFFVMIALAQSSSP